MTRTAILGLLLFLLVGGIFLPALRDDFITYDDPVYVTQNPHVRGGLTWADAAWAFRTTETSNWHPLTWLSHMADCQIFGLRPWGHHLTSVLLHALDALLVFLVFRSLTGKTGRSFAVGALFGLHPLHVESVAWVAERKDVLSTLFWLLTLAAYVAWVRAASARRPGAGRLYGLALALYAAGLMCKPMLVTVPCVLLLLDFWPLGRWGAPPGKPWWGLAAEKLPFFALAATSSAVTLRVQELGRAVGSGLDFPWSVRLAHAATAYCAYLGKCFFPWRLAVFYPYFGRTPPLGELLAAAALLAAITAGAVAFRRRRPYLLFGWLWFLGTLVPTIGLVQVGGQALADRYSYMPLVGIFVMAVWTAGDAAAGRPGRPAAWAAAAALLACAVLTVRQLGFWRNSLTLFRHALAVTDDNWVAHANLGAALERSPATAAEAQEEFRATVRILGKFAGEHNRRGVALAKMPGRLPEAVAEFRQAVQVMPDYAEAHYNLGTALAHLPGGLPEAAAEFRTALRLDPGYAEAHLNLGLVWERTGRPAEAAAEYRLAARLKPDLFPAHFYLALLESKTPGRTAEAVDEYRAALRARPDSYQAHFNLALILASLPGQRQEAIAHFQAALRLKPDLEPARVMIERLGALPAEAAVTPPGSAD